MINLKDFESSLLKIDKKSYKNIGIYSIGYITIRKIGDCENINCVNPLYLLLDHASGYTEEKNGNKYLVFVKNKKVSKKYNEWSLGWN